MIVSRRCFVEGRVQGVFYRASTQRQAIKLGVSGYAKNLPDGRVEVWVEGIEANVEELCAWLWQGPEIAVVSNVECVAVEPAGLSAFETG